MTELHDNVKRLMAEGDKLGAQKLILEDVQSRAWVRYLDGRLVLGGAGGNRPLTLRERVAWRIAQRTPNP